MRDSFRKFLAPPVFEDDSEKTRRIEILLYSSILLFVLSLILILTNFIFGSKNEKAIIVILGAVALIQLVVQWLARSGREIAAAYVLITFGWIAATIMARNVDGVRDIAILGYAAIIFGAGYLLELRAAIIFTLTSIASLWWLASLQSKGLITPSLWENPYRAALDLTIIFVAIFLIVNLLLRTLTQALETSQRELAERHRAEAELEKFIVQLSDEITERKHAQVELKSQAITDFLTGLFNRRYFFETAQKEFSKALRYERPLSVIIFDIDLFKNINDNYGHDVGDQALAQIGDLLRNTIRNVDISARYGGEEFIILLPEMNCVNTEVAAERLRKKIQDTPVDVEGILVWMTISAGVACIDESMSMKSVDQLISKADQALYEAKRAGRNQVCCYKEEK